MRNQWKGFVSGILTTMLLFGIVGTAAAMNYQKLATLDFSGIKITVDGKSVAPTDASGAAVEPFAIEGTTYLPVRGIASALGLGVEWDQTTQTVKLTSPSAPKSIAYYPNSGVPMLDNFTLTSYTLDTKRGNAMLYYYPLNSLPEFDENDENNYFAQYVESLISAGLSPKDVPNNNTFIFTFGESNDGVAIYIMDPTIIILVGDTTVSLKQEGTSNADKSDTTPTASINTAAGLQDYLNQNMSSLETPLGTYSYYFIVDENDSSSAPYDFEIKADHNGEYPWYDLEYSISISQSDKDETIALVRAFQEDVYHTAESFFPDKKLTGCFYDYYYEYPNIRAGYQSTRVLTWCNFTGEPFVFATNYEEAKLSSFHWYPSRDAYQFD